MVFSSDTGPGWDIEELGPHPDLAVLDSTFLAEHEDLGVLHMSARQAAEKARSAGARRLVLTHLAPGQEAEAHAREAGASFGGPVEVALSGSHYEI